MSGGCIRKTEILNKLSFQSKKITYIKFTCIKEKAEGQLRSSQKNLNLVFPEV